jgi:hypothetical protein
LIVAPHEKRGVLATLSVASIIAHLDERNRSKTMGNVQPPGGGLRSNFNYYLHSGCDENTGVCTPIADLVVNVIVTEPINSNIAFSIQLNALTPRNGAPNQVNCRWQQYLFNISGSGAKTQIGYAIEYWPVKGFAGIQKGDVIHDFQPLLTLPWQATDGPALEPGYELSFNLRTDSAGNVVAANFVVNDPALHATASGWITLTDLMVSGQPKKKITPAALSPISAFELNIVGPPTGRQATLSKGAGTIAYTASSPLKVLSARPSRCVSDQSIYTAEDANTVYGELEARQFDAGFPMIQTFNVVGLPFFVPGGRFAVSQQFGVQQTNLYVINESGQLLVISENATGDWSVNQQLAPTGFTRRGASIAAAQRFGADDRTDVFLVSQDEQLNCFSVEGSGSWKEPVTIGAARAFYSGSCVTVSRHFGLPDQTDVFVVAKTGQLTAFVAQGTTEWSDSAPIGPPGLLAAGAPIAASQRFGTSDQTDVFVVGKDGALNVFSVQGMGKWSDKPTVIAKPAKFPEKTYVAASQRFGVPNQTDVFAVAHDGQLKAYSVQGPGDGWSGPVAIGPSGLAEPGAPVTVSQRFGVPDQTDVFVVDKKGTLHVFSALGTGKWSDAKQIGPPGIAPTAEQLSYQTISAPFVVALAQLGVNNRTNVFVFTQPGSDGQSWPVMFWSEGAGDWNGPKQLAS